MLHWESTIVPTRSTSGDIRRRHDTELCRNIIEADRPSPLTLPEILGSSLDAGTDLHDAIAAVGRQRTTPTPLDHMLRFNETHKTEERVHS